MMMGIGMLRRGDEVRLYYFGGRRSHQHQEPVRLRFAMRSSKLFAFQFVDAE
jgi:hypothetical protein